DAGCRPRWSPLTGSGFCPVYDSGLLHNPPGSSFVRWWGSPAMAEPAVLHVHTDGASRGNPGAAAYAFVLSRPDGSVVEEQADCLGLMTNNQAEYTALVRALKRALELGPDQSLLVHSDSELMVKQMTGAYRVKNEELRGLYEQAQDLARRFK